MRLSRLLSFLIPVFANAPGGAGALLGQPGGGSPPPGAGADPPPGAGAGAGAPPGAANDVAWLGEGVAPELSGYVKNKGWTDPRQVVEGYMNLEKLRGVPAERLLTLPGDDKPESWAPIFDKLGRPKDAAGYKLPVPQGDDGKFAGMASQWFHKAGLSAKQATEVATAWNEHQVSIAKAQQEERAAQMEREVGELKTAWGGAFDQKREAARRGAATFGVDATKLEEAMGTKATMELLARIGEALGEHKTVGTDTLGGPLGGALAPDQAIAEIARLRGDAEWVKKYFAGDVEARARMERLHKWAYPDGGGSAGA